MLQEMRHVLQEEVSGADSHLARKLAEELGEDGALQQRLQQGLASMGDLSQADSFAFHLSQQLEAYRSHLSQAMDTADPSSALARLLRSQRQEAEDMRDKLRDVLHQLQRQAEAQALQAEAAAREKQLWRASTAKGFEFEEDVQTALSDVAAVFGDRIRWVGGSTMQRAAEADRLPPSASSATAATADSEAQGAPTSEVGAARSKVGDIVIELLQEQLVLPSIVVEVKAGKTSLRRLLREMDEGRARMAAGAAIGVMDRPHLGKTQRPFHEHGPDVIVVGVDWAQGDYLALEVAYRVLRARLVANALRSSSSSSGGAGPDGGPDLARLRTAVAEAYNALTRLQTMKKNATDARKILQLLRDDLDDVEETIRRQLRKVEQTALGQHNASENDDPLLGEDFDKEDAAAAADDELVKMKTTTTSRRKKK